MLKEKPRLCFVDLVKSFDSVLRKAIVWLKAIPEVSVTAMISLYEEAKTGVPYYFQ